MVSPTGMAAGPGGPGIKTQNDEGDAGTDPPHAASGDRNPVLPYPYLHERRPLPIEVAGLSHRPMQIDTNMPPEFRQPFVRFCSAALKMGPR